jgi:hypothetical protein
MEGMIMSEDCLYCFRIAEEIGVSEHCATCHGDNLFDDKVMLEYTLTDGRVVEACCPVRDALERKGMLRDRSPRPFPLR